jgi:MYXO-CTERM domain-containing protein
MRLPKATGIMLVLVGTLPVQPASGAPDGGGPKTGHPFLLFHDIKEVAGYQNRTIAPWKGWEASILASADESLKRDFTKEIPWPYDDIDYRGGFARDLAMAYQITQLTKYSDKAKEALLNMDVGYVSSPTNEWDSYRIGNQARAAEMYALAYDWMQPMLTRTEEQTVRAKLALLVDREYQDLVRYSGHYGGAPTGNQDVQAYASFGVVSAALFDYPNPSIDTTASISTTPELWHAIGKKYLFENDELHSLGGRSLLSFGFDEDSGKYINGYYKVYTMGHLVLWPQVSARVFGENLLDAYPLAKKAVTSEMWELLPNEYSDSFNTNANHRWEYHWGVVSLLSDQEKSVVLNHLERSIREPVLLRYSWPAGSAESGVCAAVSYAAFGDYANLPRSFPTEKSHLNPRAITQLIRGAWKDDADWLSLITFNKVTGMSRAMAHDDQLSFEYYSRGELLLADAGEPQFVSIAGASPNYGHDISSHNAIGIENPRAPFAVSYFGASRARPIAKGVSTKVLTPPTVDTIIQVPWMQAVQARVDIKQVSKDEGIEQQEEPLSSSIPYARAVLYPESDYFIIVDRLEGTETWTYRNVFRPTALMITPTADSNNDGKYSEEEAGYVNGDLTVGTQGVEWKKVPFKIEPASGPLASSISWAIPENPYKRPVRLDLVSAPVSEVLVAKHVGRIAGRETGCEVFNPVVSFRVAPAKTLYRVTSLLSRYDDGSEVSKTGEVLAVQGDGNALKIRSGDYDDVAYTGQGEATFDRFSTDAQTVFLRAPRTPSVAAPISITLLQGSKVHASGSPRITTSGTVNYLSYHREGAKQSCKIQTGSAVDLRLYGMDSSRRAAATMDGSPLTGINIEAAGTVLVVPVPSGEHLLEVMEGANDGGEAGTGGNAGTSGSDASVGPDSSLAGMGGDTGLVPDEPAESGGCGCQSQSKGPLLGGLLSLLGIGVILARRRKRLPVI